MNQRKKKQLAQAKRDTNKSVSPPKSMSQSLVQQETKLNPPEQPEVVQPQFDYNKYVRLNISKQDVIDLKKSFDIFDQDQSGTIDAKELLIAFESMGYNAHSRMIYQVLAELDQDNSGEIGFDEYYKLALMKGDNTNTELEIQRIFNLFDQNKDGKISKLEFKNVSDALGDNQDDEWISKQFGKIDLDQDGIVTYEEFYNMMTNHKIYWG